jgi:hypothetical protein
MSQQSGLQRKDLNELKDWPTGELADGWTAAETAQTMAGKSSQRQL